MNDAQHTIKEDCMYRNGVEKPRGTCSGMREAVALQQEGHVP